MQSVILNDTTSLSFTQRYFSAFHGYFENEILLCRLHECDVEALHSALQALVDRHPLLRTTFHATGECGDAISSIESSTATAATSASVSSLSPPRLATPSTAIRAVEHAPGSFPARVDFHAVDCSHMHAEVESVVLSEAFREFPLARASLMRARLFWHAGKHFRMLCPSDGTPSAAIPSSLGTILTNDIVQMKTKISDPIVGEHILLISVAPIVADKWSLTLLIDDLKGVYGYFCLHSQFALVSRGRIRLEAE